MAITLTENAAKQIQRQLAKRGKELALGSYPCPDLNLFQHEHIIITDCPLDMHTIDFN
jgi:hypothetical protein